MRHTSFVTKFMGSLVLLLVGVLIWNGIQNSRIRRDTKEVPVDYAQYTSDAAYNKLCRMEVKGLVLVGIERSSYRDSAGIETARYYLAILKDGSNGLVKLDTIGGMWRDCSPWIARDKEDLEKLKDIEPLTLLGKTTQMPKLNRNSIESLLYGIPDISKITDDMLAKITLLETGSEYKETKMVAPNYASLGSGAAIIVLLLFSFGVIFAKSLLVDATLAQVEKTSRIRTGNPDSTSIVQEMYSKSEGEWYQYDILLRKSSSWEEILDWADYMAASDIASVSEIRVGGLTSEETDITDFYRANDSRLGNLPEAAEACEFLSLGGLSDFLWAPIKIIWLKDTRVLRLFTSVEEESQIICYVETMFHRTFETEK